MLWRVTKKFQFAADRVIPDPLVLCLVLVLIVFIAAFLGTPSSFMEVLSFFYDGFFGGLFLFGFQMGLIILFAGTAAKAPLFARTVDRISKLPKSVSSALIFMLIFSAVTSWINWAFGLILTPILSTQLCRNIKGLHFPLMVASGYAMMIMVQPLSLSTPVVNLMASPGHFLEEITGVVPAAGTAFNPVGLIAYGIMALVTIVVVVLTRPPKDEIIGLESAPATMLNAAEKVSIPRKEMSPADKMNASKILGYVFPALLTVYVVWYFANNGINMTTNFIIFFFFTACAWLYHSPLGLMTAIAENIGSIPQVVVQFPLYGAIMGMMSSSGLSTIIVNWLLSISTAKTFPVLTYWSASLLNLFVPSQGGQWAIQGPIIEAAAQTLDVSYGLTAVCFMFGDEATNLLQPFYVIPALALLGMKLKAIWGYMAFLWVLWFVIASVCFYVLPESMGLLYQSGL